VVSAHCLRIGGGNVLAYNGHKDGPDHAQSKEALTYSRRQVAA